MITTLHHRALVPQFPATARLSSARRARRTERHQRGAPPPGLYPGWFVVLGAFIVTLVGFGAAYSYAAIAGRLQDAFGASPTQISLLYGICGFTAFMSSAATGPLADRIGSRLPAIIGMMLVGIGLATAAAARTMIEIYVSFGLGVGCGVGFSYVPAVAAVQRWFVASRGVASGLATAGVGVGTALVPAGAMILVGIGDWRVTLLIAGILAVAVGTGGAMLLRSAPENYGLRPDGADAGPAAAQALPVLEGLETREVLATGSFWLLYATTLLVCLPMSLPFAHLALSAQANGLAFDTALSLLSVIGISSIFGRCLIGAVSDKIGRPVCFIACCAAIGGMTLLWAATVSEAWYVAFAIGFGIAYGGFIALLPAFVADTFGRRSVSSVLGVLLTGRAVSQLLAAPLLADLVGRMGGYAVPLLIAAVPGLIGAVLACFVVPARHATYPVHQTADAAPQPSDA